ncbi:Dps family protein [Cohnella sp. REN36]|uniref:Dps family protein n=1 Tax=Cohnella sp. REN36 TaxID=2887347 RepID=UPI001D13CCA9|nr:DNA starvation/stationary phase protection protein [Cohnella sp. REN36]MCC3371698.1 DNA starvation/stationary phase protection protein [Cohnella sp. REN36]
MSERNQTLNRQIANWTVLYTKLHHYHWNVKGPQFYTLHAQFETLYSEAAERLDVLAERLLALGGCPVSTLKDSLALATVQEASGGESADQMVSAIAKDFTQLIVELNEGIAVAEAEHDEPTADLFIGQIAELQKHVWMLNAYLG